MSYLKNLEKHYHDMENHGCTASQFSCEFNNRALRVLIFKHGEDLAMIISSLGEDPAFFIKENISTETFDVSNVGIDQTNYNKLVSYLEWKNQDKNPFNPTKFMAAIDRVTPDHISDDKGKTSTAGNESKAEAKHFSGWAIWSDKNTTGNNALKTASVIGPSLAVTLKSLHISSCWSSSPDKEDPTKLEKWVEDNQ